MRRAWASVVELRAWLSGQRSMLRSRTTQPSAGTGRSASSDVATPLAPSGSSTVSAVSGAWTTGVL